MRVLVCNYEYPPLGGGGGVATAWLAQELAKRHQVTILTSQGLGLPAESFEDGVRIVRVPVFFRGEKATANLLSMLAYIPMGVRAGKELLKAERYDIINTHFALPSGPVGDALACFANIPNVLTVHGGDLYDPSKFTSPHRHALLRAWVRNLLQRADRFVGQSTNTLANVRNFYGLDLEGSRIPLGIKRPPEGSASRQDYGFNQDEVLLVSVGRLVARKATGQLIAMMDTLRNENVRLLVLGSGPQEQMLKKEVVERRLSSKVRFMGFVEELEKFRLLRLSDIYVSTSQHEGFGLVFLEAMACGLPVICYDYGGQTDFLEDGTTGYLAPLNDLKRFTDRLLALMRDSNLRRKMGQHNLQKAEGFFIDNCAKRYEAIFSEVIANHRKEISNERLS
jgi:glycosyltransferase involved in cell wall biosynthesis